MARVATDNTGLIMEDADRVCVTGKCRERGRPFKEAEPAADTLELRW